MSTGDVPTDRSALRRGWTTGACAAAAATAAYRQVLTGVFPEEVTITLPKGVEATFTPRFLGSGRKRGKMPLLAHCVASVIKDAGDDPDVTHGAEIVASVYWSSDKPQGVKFGAGEGVGRITRPGLKLAVGEPAINPAPRRIITENLAAIAREAGKPLAASVVLSIPGGEELAQQTLNGRLGIVGGLSILGTTGVVIPYSTAAWIDTIHRGIDVALACGQAHLLAATGTTSEQAGRDHLGLSDECVIEMGDFAGALFKYLRHKPVPRLTLAGGFAKLTKLGQGHLNLHSSESRVDMESLADLLGDPSAARANSANQVLDWARTAGIPLGDRVAAAALATARAHLKPETAIEVLVVDRAGNLAGRAGEAGAA